MAKTNRTSEEIAEQFKPLIDEAKKVIFEEDYQDKVSDEEVLGILVSKFCKWDGIKIGEVCTTAFEDSNFNSLAQVVSDEIEKL